jgi:hypothetical protein
VGPVIRRRRSPLLPGRQEALLLALTGPDWPVSSTLIPCVICLDAAIYLVHLSILPTLTHPSLQYHNHPQSPARLSLSHRSASATAIALPTASCPPPATGSLPTRHTRPTPHSRPRPFAMPCNPRARFSLKPLLVRCHAHCCTFLVLQNPSHRIEIVRSHSHQPQSPPANLRTHLLSLTTYTAHTYAPARARTHDAANLPHPARLATYQACVTQPPLVLAAALTH